LVIGMHASEQTDERTFRGVAEGSVTTGPDGEFSLEAPCGSRLQLSFRGWIWAGEPPEVIAEPASGGLDITLIAERSARLSVVNGRGEAMTAELHRPGGEVIPIPPAGVEIVGLPYGHVAGTIVAEGSPDRIWRMNRSDVLAEVQPRRFEATVRLDPQAPVWIHVPDPRDVTGIWCVAEGARAAPCKLRDSAWYCECGGIDRVGIATTLWDVALVRDVVGKDLVVQEWPPAVTQCIHAADAGTADIRPAGVADRLLLGTTGIAANLCVTLPRGERLEVVVGDVIRPHVPMQPGDIEL
jgi:hypothetical protein